MLTETTRYQIIELQRLYPNKRSALIPALHLAQKEKGYLPREVQAEIATLFEVAENEVHGIVTFYDMFFDQPHGKHLLHVCKNISCMLRGGDRVIEKFCQKLNIAPGETTADGNFTLIRSECLGACDCAPVMLIDEKLVGPVHHEDVDDLISTALNGSLTLSGEGGHA